MEILNEFSDQTIKLEHSRNPSSMSTDDLYWCFATKIIFLEEKTDSILFEIEETSFFSFLLDLRDIAKLLSDSKSGEYVIEDNDGAFSFMIKSDGSKIIVKQDYPPVSFELPQKVFLQAANIWFAEARGNIEKIFPELKENPNYKNLEL